MRQIRQAALDHQARRWLRHDWRRFFSPGSQNDPLYRYYQRVERKYAGQSRVPAGQPEGGQWTSGGGTNPSQVDPARIDQPVPKPKKPERSTTGSGAAEQDVTRVAGRIPPALEAECADQYRKDTFICNTVRTQSCWEQAAFRRAQCLGGRYIPPIYH